MQYSELKEKLFRYEIDFFCAEFCKDVNNLESRLGEDFYEIGSSGAKITRDEVIQVLSGLVEDREIEISEFAVNMLDEDTTLVRYKASFKENDKESWRISIWKRQKGDWVMFYHQGTECK
jgi:hypothetical protein